MVEVSSFWGTDIPTRSLKPCPTPGCPRLVQHGRCASCQAAYQRREQARRGSAARRGYDRAWQNVRAEYAREHPYCEDHLEQGERIPTQIIDHIIPLPHGPRLDKRNLRAYCRSCHGFKTAREQRGQTCLP